MKLRSFPKNIFYLWTALSAFVVTGSLVILTKHPKEIRKQNIPQKYLSFSDLPMLSGNTPEPIMSAEAALAVDITSGEVLFEKSPDEPLLPASTTKIITALVAMDYYSDDMILQVGKIKIEGQKMGLLEGERIRVRDLLDGLLIYSANDAAEVLAQNFPGGRDFFIYSMNLKARQLHLDNSSFNNPVGLDDDGQMMSARDLVKASNFAIKNSEFASIVATKEKTVKSVDGKIAHKLVNLNKLVKDVEGVLGVKTGWTENAKENLVTYIDRNNKKVMIALLGSEDRFSETKQLINWIFSNYQWGQ
ncbi:hypothetical protein A3D00_01100 [Candidatus Woesebacteria bacterium RIFCSPHIGHO2_02_FULL_38_9]|uniref:Peptidase S11 D-alanyl-D-alanine carboxypeptidase A N-terminal domain-containing protein n=1 Tax=Candidatus Woesebacteria bacterium RIFCSPHIGHO2_01_FULL_39_28 TaxID=1802496 RepID=A0A1F7YHI6_9BACT|nr:MAG: hypothetical protein A2627_01295 [Candidatus Woesebacteria bacterium RIFCSPHIGHO2_01_FULL_39_28]OGM31720.1 MAG: hypothetical protein A3D00_01100 [Candidatus Woesebacteria bacterium RIFCSPHIGHO2_02_FULL_38_9]OGM57661.1 MAG: hypothetical protein A3A50_01475 [Candidatus Woesebacteria bacterium RIFCSPLOWO2_01_FULL_38_20]